MADGMPTTGEIGSGGAMRATLYLMPFLATLLLTAAGTAAAQDVYAYPSKGQSRQQQEQDQFQCYNWAKQQTGFDPMQVPRASSPPPQQQSTGPGVLGGAAGGAALGAIGGAIAGDAGKGAAIGAATGGVFGGVRSRQRSRQNQQARQQWEQQQAAQYQQARGNYNRAYSACMQSRGYTIN